MIQGVFNIDWRPLYVKYIEIIINNIYNSLLLFFCRMYEPEEHNSMEQTTSAGSPKKWKYPESRLKGTVVTEPQKIIILNYVKEHFDSLYGKESSNNGRPSNSELVAWNKVFELCQR